MRSLSGLLKLVFVLSLSLCLIRICNNCVNTWFEKQFEQQIEEDRDANK